MPTVIWILLALAVIAACAGGSKGKSGRKGASDGKPVRIDHPHYIDLDDHECSVCGARFRGKGMTCPKCGAVFSDTREDDEEFIEEMVLWDDEDD